MMRLLRKYSWALCFTLLLAACSKVPDHILSQNKMRAVLKDMLVAESMVFVESKTYQNDTTKMALYESVFRKHGITRELYDSSVVWYGQNLDIYMKVYDRVLADLNKDIVGMGDVQAKAAPILNKDSANIWPRREFLVFSPKAVFNGVTFDIQPEVRYSSGSTFALRMDVWGVDCGLKNKPEIRICADQGDTTIIVNEKIMRDGYHQTVVRTVPTKNIRRVYGYIRLDNAADSTYFKVYLDNLKLIRFKYGKDHL